LQLLITIAIYATKGYNYDNIFNISATSLSLSHYRRGTFCVNDAL
jgi:hypothetical protein